MSAAIQDARQRLVDEMLAELQELSERRSDLLREMFRLIRYGETGNPSFLLDDEQDEHGRGLEQFLERFDLQKNLETGSILTLEIPDVNLKTYPTNESTADVGEEPAPEAVEAVPPSDDLKHMDDEGDLQYPKSSPGPTRSHLPKIVKDTGTENVAMDVDVSSKGDEEPSTSEVREETPVNIEDEDEQEQHVEEQRTPPRTRARTRTASPIASRNRKRRRSDMSIEHGQTGETEKLQVPSDDVRQTRSKARKVTPPPSAAQAEDDDVDELDIISLSSPSNTSPPWRRISPRHRRSESVQHEEPSTAEGAEKGEPAQAEQQEVVAEEELAEPMQVDEQMSDAEEKVVPPSPSTPSVHSPPKSPSVQAPSPEARESPIRAPKPREPYIVDTTPLTPPRSPPPPIVIRLPAHQPEQPIYHFVEEQSAASNNAPEVKTENEPTLPPESERPRTSSVELKLAKKHAFNFTLPPLSSLPVEFNRKGKPTKRRRDKERERSGSDAARKDDWVPLGIAKWAALMAANPSYKKLNRATKCVSTKEWNTATTELRLVKTLERIDVLKRTGKWSFRQLKKQRVAAGLVKTHWDYLMDEMKWMQVDFREERRWKIALAFELALCVQEWHAAGSHEERIRLGICAPWRRPDPRDSLPVDEHRLMEVDIAPPPAEDEEHDAPYQEDNHPSKDNTDCAASDNEDEDVEDQRAVTAALMADNTVAEASEEVQQPFTVPDPPEAPTITMKLEEVEGADALHLAGPTVSSENNQISFEVPQDANNHWTEEPKTEIMDASEALKETSSNPTMDSQPATSTNTGEGAQKREKSLWTPEQAKHLRSSILSLPEETLAITMDQFVPMSDEELMKSLDPDGNSHTSHDLSTVFPELQPFSLIDAPNSEIVGPCTDGKKKTDKKADKDDPTKRVEETTYTRLCPTSRFMHVKPTLVSALQPAKTWRKGKWIDLDESPVVSDVDSPPPLSAPENSCTLFGGRRITIPFQPPLVVHNYSKIPRSPSRTLPIPWSPAEDSLLKSLAERYPSNWRLVADALNSSRIRTSIDLRTPQECFERWRIKCGLPTRPMHPGSVQNAQPAVPTNNEEGTDSNGASGENVPPPPPSTAASVGTSQMTTRGIKRLANSAAQNAATLSVNTGAATVESRKRKRHLIIYDSLKKVQNRRQRQRKQDEVKYQGSANVAPVHDTHHQINSKPRFTPFELSKVKEEREKKEVQMQMLRRREFEAKRQQHQQQQQQLQAQIQQAQHQQQQQQQQQPQQSQQLSQQNVALSQNVPQIRTQMMQQQAQAAQQARVLAQAQAQAQAQQSQAQQGHPQLQGQMTNAQPTINGTVPHLSTQYVNHGGSNSPVAQHTSPPRSSATPVNSVAAFPRPNSAQRNVSMPGNQVLPMAGGSVPIARTNNALAAYFANSAGQYTPEQMSHHLMRYQAAQQAQQQQLQMQQQQQQPMQMQMQTGQQNALQGGMAGYPPTG